MHTNVLVIDDEPELAEYTAKYFNMSGVDTRFVLSRQEALDFLGENTCSLVLLDINLGGDSGFDLCREIRSTTDVPIFFISARSSEDDMLLALSIGGDDYICKPFSLGVLLAKVKAVLKRYEEKGGSTSDEGLIQLGSSCFDMKKAAVIRDGVSTGLKAMEYKLLVYMLKNRGRVIPKDEFFEKVWETDYVSDVTLNVHIRHLREKIEQDPGEPRVIKTIWGVGFMLEDGN
ncbi:response regulator transcription factor [uncultured Ruminococcus sp.]|uniref:response regulator transcription factor n=1 Tax=uncultured Ruminococcus sp. TaxID=165186 RepID=UPI0026056656|nr:response regulator transcription factor [uncultured Ruminococcus sp.]